MWELFSGRTPWMFRADKVPVPNPHFLSPVADSLALQTMPQFYQLVLRWARGRWQLEGNTSLLNVIYVLPINPCPPFFNMSTRSHRCVSRQPKERPGASEVREVLKMLLALVTTDEAYDKHYTN